MLDANTVKVTAFTFLLFLSGYVIQQRTVQGLQAAIRPRAPFPHVQALVPTVTDPRVKASRPFGRLKDYAKLQLHLQEQGKPFSWDRLAYAQIVREHSEVCDALILFGELYRSKSPVPKLLLFPAAWISDKDESNQEWETTHRLLRKATRRYRATLVPIEGSSIWENPREKNLFFLKDYERVITLPPPGLVLNSLPLDTLLAYHQIGEAISAYPPVKGNGSGSSMIMARPSTKHIPTLPLSIIPSIFSSASNPDLPLPSIFSNIVSLRMPHAPNEPFNATKFLSETAYVHISDPELPGPEYDLPYYEMVRRRPEDEDQGYLWEKMYSTYKDRRYEVCGLDLETWPPIGTIGNLDRGDQRTDL
jgi:hypothetical protein